MRMQKLHFTIVIFCLTFPAIADDWPQWRGPQRDGVWRETGITDKLNTDSEGNIKLKWSSEIGAGYSQPTVANGRIYVTDRVDDPDEIERVHCFDFKTGNKLWSIDYPAAYTIGYKSGPRAAVHIDGKNAYALGGVGHLHCLSAATGDIIWKRDLANDYKIDMPRWGIAAAPIIEGNLIILHIGGAQGACVVGLNKQTGKEKWRAIHDDASYAAPIIIDQAGKRVLVVYSADELFGLDPATGKKYWSFAMPGSKWPISIATPVITSHNGNRYIFATNAHVGTVLLKLGENNTTIDKVWRQQNPRLADAMYSLIPTPFIRNGHIYGTHNRGELRCLELLTGKQVWQSTEAVKPDRFSTLHIVAQGTSGGRVWIFNEHGELIIADLTPTGYKQISRGKLVEPTQPGLPSRRGGVTWAHPAFANKHVIARNDKRMVCADLSDN